MISRLQVLRTIQNAWPARCYSSSIAAKHSYCLQNGENIHYATYGLDTADATLILCHGAPGSHNDFKHLAPLLASRNLQVIAFDLPGNGQTSANAAGGKYGLNEKAMANAVVEALDGMNISNSFVLGHSFGGHTAIRVAATAKSVRGLALLTSVGLRPHHVVRRFPMVQIGRMLQEPVAWRPLLVLMNKWYYLYGLKFPKRTPEDDFTYALQRIGSTDFKAIEQVVAQVKERNLATFVALAQDDAFIEPEIVQELGQALPTGIRVEYPTGGHNIQKTRAKELAESLSTWIANTVM